MSDHIDPLQFAYLEGRSCEDALLYLMHTVYTGCDVGIVRCTFMDYSSAFNLVSHQLLVNKLAKMNIPVRLLHVIVSFLKDRPQVTQIGTKKSAAITINTGTPQGSVVSPILYILYTDDLRATTCNCKILKYADDTAIVGVIKCEEDFMLYQQEINHVCTWSEQSCLFLNPRKTQELVFDFTVKPCTYGKIREITVKDENVHHTDNVKYLGVMINNRLGWEDQVNYVVHKVIKRNYALKLFSSIIVDHQWSKILYLSLVQSVLETSCTVWTFGLTVKQEKKLERQSKISCKILGVHSKELLPLTDRRLDLVHKKYIKIEENDSVLNSFICQKMLTTGQYRLGKARTSRCFRSFFFSAPQFLNRQKLF